MKTILVTGGAGFIGSAVIRQLLANGYRVVNVDKMTYAANPMTNKQFEAFENYTLEKVDITDISQMERIYNTHCPDGVMHLAAESHVDRSIDSSDEFIQTNIIGTHVLLEQSRKYLHKHQHRMTSRFVFHHVSTDEVFGSLGDDDDMFTETTRYKPNSPYSASKAASDHLVRAWHKTYDLPVVMSNCSNNYGPYQFPEKLIPLIIQRALQGESLPVYGNGQNIRDWLYVDDHAKALLRIYEQGNIGESYNVGGNNEIRNIDVVTRICTILDKLSPHASLGSYKELIQFVEDRPGHDYRYAIDSSKMQNELEWQPEETFDTGIEKTVQWYVEHQLWCEEALRCAAVVN